jgi:hypothetical protein
VAGEGIVLHQPIELLPAEPDASGVLAMMADTVAADTP